MEPIISEAVPRKNRLLVCPECVGLLLNDKSPETSEQLFIYRKRRCLNCNTIFHTKQPPEEITHPLCYKSEQTENRILTCPNPDCKDKEGKRGKLSSDRDAYTSHETSDRGFIYRHRICLECGMDVHTKQPPEEITSIEPPLM